MKLVFIGAITGKHFLKKILGIGIPYCSMVTRIKANTQYLLKMLK